MNNNFEKSAFKIGAFATIAGSVCMLSGAAIWGASGAIIPVGMGWMVAAGVVLYRKNLAI